jgi:hypothetical protein
VLYFPIWWYSRGFISVLKKATRSVIGQYEFAGVGVWLKNLFIPMFGQYDWEGRLISFFVRLVQIFFRSIFLLIWVVFIVCLVILWLAAPLYVVYQIYRQIAALL